MDYKTASRLVYTMPSKKKAAKDTQRTGSKEDAIIGAIDLKRNIEKYTTLLEDLKSGRKDVHQALGESSPEALVAILEILASGSEKGKLAAAQDLLDRSGYGKVQKHALATVDASQSKEALISLLMGASKNLKDEGIEVIDDREDPDQTE